MRNLVQSRYLNFNALVMLIALVLASLIILLHPTLVFFLLFFIIFLGISLLDRKYTIYFVVLVYPLLSILTNVTQMQLGGRYFGINIGGFINICVVLQSLFIISMLRSKIFKYRLSMPILLFLFSLGISILFSSLKFMSLREWFRYAMPALIYFIVISSFDDFVEAIKLLKFILIASVIPLSFAFWQLVTGDNTYPLSGAAFNRIYSTFGHPNPFAIYLVVIILLSIYIKTNAVLPYRWLIFAVSLVALFFTFTRVGWLSFIVAITLSGFLKYRKLYFAILLFGLLIIMLVPDFNRILISRLHPDNSFMQRFQLNALGLSLFKQKPLFGHGLGSYSFLSRPDVGATLESYGIKLGLAPHNDYIGFLVSGGSVLFCTFIFVVYRAFVVAIKLLKSKIQELISYSIFLISSITAILVFALTDQGFEYAGLYFWIFVAIGEILLNHYRQVAVNKD